MFIEGKCVNSAKDKDSDILQDLSAYFRKE